MRQLDSRFPCISSASTDPLRIPLLNVVEELARELDLRRKSYPGRVERGKMSGAEAEWQIDVMAAIHVDLQASLLLIDGSRSVEKIRLAGLARTAADRRLLRFRWAELVEVLQREVALRRRWYPDLIAQERLSAAASRLQLERMEAAHFFYWRQARRFWPDELDAKRYRAAELTIDERALFRAAERRHLDRFVDLELDQRGAYAADDEDEAEGWAA
ncbi:hypothetical protein [Sphingobium lignivorans]|uniref:Uncharacterized protein n=1 Tax=Sphingobium lignivorans TaxID=2735886 RepID=A0ABR6NDI8_9SPHN|nr:hypothetical protein [Sphingobium lignivorans]MBB5985337.1 hypothetical protein [Sphingobium lignivorans]